MEKKHSGLGIASFIISTATGVLMFLLFVVAGVMEASTPGGIGKESAAAMIVGIFLIAFLMLDMLAVGLGIAGLVQKDRKKVFPTLGVVIGASTISIALFTMVLGLMA